MIRILSRPPRWDILENFYRVFDKGRKRGCVEQWQKEMPKSLLEREMFETKIHIEFLNDRRETEQGIPLDICKHEKANHD